MNPDAREALSQRIESYLTANRRERIRTVIGQRTRHITVAVEDVFQEHNASAVIRTCDCFGIQEMHVIE
ncbi:MAG: TrmH family RNA methyltransferase, partial [Bacteroidota bacterium]